MKILWILCLISVARLVHSKPVRGCSGRKGTFFVGDSDDPCVYYWCEDGNFLPWVFPCSYGASVPYGYFGQIVPCIDNLRTCYGGVPKAAIIRDPELANPVVPMTVRPSKLPQSTTSPLVDDLPTLSHQVKNIDEKPFGPFDRTTQPTSKPSFTTTSRSTTNKADDSGSSSPSVQIAPTDGMATSSPRQVLQTTGGYLYSSVIPFDDRSTQPKANDPSQHGRPENTNVTPTTSGRTSPQNYVPTDDQRKLPFEKKSSTTMASNIQTTTPFFKQTSSTVQPTSRPTSTTTRRTTSTRPRTTTMSKATAATTARSTIIPPMTTTTRITTTTLEPTMTTEEEFDFGFESGETPKGGPDSFPRVVDHGETGEEGTTPTTTVEVREKQKIFTEPTVQPTRPMMSTERPTPPFTTTTQTVSTTTSVTIPTTTQTSPITTTETTTPTPTTSTTSPTTVRFIPQTTRFIPTTTTTPQPTTTTPAITTTPEPTTDPCVQKMPMRGGGQVITQVFPQHHIIGGEPRTNFTFQIGVIHVTLEIKMASMCYLACDLHPGCAGFDWNIEDSSCWFHSETNECSSPVLPVDGAVAHYRLEACAEPLKKEQTKGKLPERGLRPEKPEDSRGAVKREEEDSPFDSANDPGVGGDGEELPHDGIQGDESIQGRGPAPRDERRNKYEWETGRQRVFDMSIDHGQRRAAAEWEHGSSA